MTLPLASARRARQSGFSLIELMISMVIGMVVVGAVFAAYLGMGTSSRSSRALAQMTEDVSLAMNVLRSHVSMAGYSAPTGRDANGFTLNYNGMAIKGCQSRFTDTGASIDTLACSGLGSDAIAVAYEADNTHAIVNDIGQPLDCLGNGITIGGGFYVSYSRFFVNGNQLFCRGPGSDTPQALVENIVDMEVLYGVASGAEPNHVAYYARAGNAGEMTNDDFNNVISARICLVVASENEVMDNITSYIDCQGNEDTPTDKRMYRAFTSTMVLQNRMGLN